MGGGGVDCVGALGGNPRGLPGACAHILGASSSSSSSSSSSAPSAPRTVTINFFSSSAFCQSRSAAQNSAAQAEKGWRRGGAGGWRRRAAARRAEVRGCGAACSRAAPARTIRARASGARAARHERNRADGALSAEREWEGRRGRRSGAPSAHWAGSRLAGCGDPRAPPKPAARAMWPRPSRRAFDRCGCHAPSPRCRRQSRKGTWRWWTIVGCARAKKYFHFYFAMGERV